MPLIDDLPKFIDSTGKPGLEKDGEELTAPKRAVPNAATAKTIYERMRQAHSKRAYTFARIEGMIDGNPPYKKQSLARSGLQTNSNVNWRDGESIYESVALAYWSLFNDVQFIAEFSTTIGDPNENPMTAQIVAEEFDRVLRDWPEFNELLTEHQADLIKFGVSWFFWPDERTWLFEVGDVWRVLIPEKTRNRSRAVSVCAVEQTMTAQELWDIYENASENSKWNKQVLEEVLLRTANFATEKNKEGQTFIDLQRQIRNGDTAIDALYNDDIGLVSILIKEWDGKISRGIFHPEVQTTSNESDGWLFYSDRQYESIDDALMLFTFTPGQKFIHGNKGIGHKIFNTIEGVTRLDNSLMDAAQRSTTVLVRTRTGRNKDLKQIQFTHGGFVDIGDSEFQENLMGANLNSNVETSRYFQSKLERNNAISGSSMSTPDGKPRTLGEVRVQTTREARVQKNRISHYYLSLDTFVRAVVRKMLKLLRDGNETIPGYAEAKLWKERCLKRGVPKEFFELNSNALGQNGLPEHMDVRATRASGSGSQVADQIETETMMQILPTTGERGRKNILRDFVAAHRGFRYIDRYLPPEDQTEQPVGDDTWASMENNQLEKGEMVVVSPDNNHAVHAPRHLNRMDQIARAFNEAEMAAKQQGSEDPSIDAANFGQYSLEEVDIAFQTLGPHFVRHLLYLQQDPTRRQLAESLNARWAILANFGDKIANNAQEHREKQIRDLRKQQEQMAQLDSEERIKMRQVELDARVKLAKLQTDAVLAGKREQFKYLLQREKVSFEKDLAARKAAVEMSRQASKTDREEVQGRDNEGLY